MRTPALVLRRSLLAAVFLAFASVASAQSEITVYVTPKGTVYHRSNCRYLKNSKPIAMTMAEAAKRHTACKVCKPPT